MTSQARGALPLLTNGAALSFILAFLFLCVFGCEPRTNYQVLSFFFDGVPNPDQAAQNGTAGGEKPKLARTTYREHGPFAAKMCDGCHDRSTNVLIMPVEKLCLNCHTIPLDKKYIHGPVVSGGCKVCHDPHGSAFPFLLVSEPVHFCYYCHSEKDVMKNEVHNGVTEACTVCHNAHMSDKQYLLK